jgi:hypothetical protein
VAKRRSKGRIVLAEGGNLQALARSVERIRAGGCSSLDTKTTPVLPCPGEPTTPTPMTLNSPATFNALSESRCRLLQVALDRSRQGDSAARTVVIAA